MQNNTKIHKNKRIHDEYRTCETFSGAEVQAGGKFTAGGPEPGELYSYLVSESDVQVIQMVLGHYQLWSVITNDV